MTIKMHRNLYVDKSVEIAGHGYYHKNTQEDIAHGISSLCNLLNTSALYCGRSGFASPNSKLSKEEAMALFNDFDCCSIDYVRLSFRYLSNPVLKAIARKVSRIIKIPFLYKVAYRDTLMASVENGILYSIPILSCVTIAQINSVIKLAIKQNKACVLMFHGITEKDKIHDNWDFDVEKFMRLCRLLYDYQTQGKVKVLTSMDLYHCLSSIF